MTLIPPHAQFRDFLTQVEHDALLDWCLSNKARFRSASVKSGKEDSAARLDASQRVALKLRDLGPVEAMVRERMLAALPRVMAAAGASGPKPRSLELELTCYGDGAFFGAHTDVPIGPGRTPIGAEPGEDRIISAVYYFHALPKAFEGGELALFPLVGVGEPVTIAPIDNSLAIFPSWARHEVQRVTCPSRQFGDARFALNVWYCRALS